MALTFDKINDLTGAGGIIGTDLLGSSRIRDNLSIGKNLTVTEKISLNGTINGSSVLDDDTFATATDTTLATTESIKAYVDAQVDTASATMLASQQSIKAYVDSEVSTNHYVTYTTDNRPNTSSARYITWDKGGRATASLTYSSMKAEIIMPFAGTIISLTIYPDNNTTTDWGSTVAQIHKNRATQAPDGNVTVVVDHQSTELFTFPDGNTFDIGDRMAIRLTPTSTMQYFVASLLVKFEV